MADVIFRKKKKSSFPNLGARVRDRVVVAADPEREKIHIDTMRQDPEEARVRDRVVVAADPEREKIHIDMMRQEEAKVRDRVVVAADPER